MTLEHRRSAGQSDFKNAELRATARPLLRAWLGAVEHKIQAKSLKDLDYRLAVILTNFPSANEGKCWPRQKRLARQAGRSERTIREALGRLVSRGLLMRRRGGQGRTSCYAFAIDGALIFTAQSENWSRSSAQLRRAIAAPERQGHADKPLELHSPEENLSPSSPCAGGNEVIDLGDQRSRTKIFDRFWDACDASERGKKGPASAEWDRLSITDLSKIVSLLGRDHRIDLGGMWACRWLKQRRWENISIDFGDTLPSEKLINGDLPGWRGWEQVGQDLASSLGAKVFVAWFDRTKIVEVSDERVLLLAPTRFVASWIRRNFYPQLLACWRARHPAIARVEVSLDRST